MMQIGMIGLGKMGSNMSHRLMNHGHDCFVFDMNEDSVRRLASLGAQGFTDIKSLVLGMQAPRVVWVMVPAGEAVDKVINELAEHLEAGDIVIDGGNSFYKEATARAKLLEAKGIHFLDIGTSGGVFGKERGYCLMVGGKKEAFEHCEPLFRALAPLKDAAARTQGREGEAATSEEGYLHCGPSGAGHFVKMVHNGIEYGLMQAYAEGFDLLKGAQKDHLPDEHKYSLDVAEITELWRRGSVIGSWLLDLSAQALKRDPQLKDFSGHINDSGEGRWTVNTAVEQGVPAEVLTTALYKRFRSRQKESFSEKAISAMRFEFGGHKE